MSRSRIAVFLRREVPYTKERMAEWKKDARALGDEAPPVMIETLLRGSPNEQYAALLAIREFGYEAWAHGRLEETTYSVSKPGTATIHIKPDHPVDDLEWQSKPAQPKARSVNPKRRTKSSVAKQRIPRRPHRV